MHLLIGLFFISTVSAATIYGTVYDLSLKKLNNARVEINTVPKQFTIAQNSSYSFNVPNGYYTIKAQLVQKNVVLESVEENITINQEGNYVLDLILFPNVEEGVEAIDVDVNGNVLETKKSSSIFVFVVPLIILFAAIIGIFYFKKSRKKPAAIKNDVEKTEEKFEDDYLEQLIKIIKHEGGRVTQKEIRKQIPLSEAKISLMIAELEHKGVIDKIKKGRGNIIILKKR